MRTAKPIATITYNTPGFLKQKLDESLKNGLIASYAFIKHEGEPTKFDEDGAILEAKKPHIHVHVFPKCPLEVTEFCDLFKELDPQNPSKPLRMLYPERPKSVFKDWYLYCTHNHDYLMKHEKKDSYFYRYKKEDFTFSDPDLYDEYLSDVEEESVSVYRQMKEFVEKGGTFREYLETYNPPIGQIYALERVFNLYYFSYTQRQNWDFVPKNLADKGFEPTLEPSPFDNDYTG